ncbi:hypothetical protein CMU99_16135 [Elizabethkingia anophelis]|nr:hypothetical protein [Elizabethkingia anophelis]
MELIFKIVNEKDYQYEFERSLHDKLHQQLIERIKQHFEPFEKDLNNTVIEIIIDSSNKNADAKAISFPEEKREFLLSIFDKIKNNQ